MEIKIQAVHFDATEKLQEFATKKVEKLSRSYEDIKKGEGLEDVEYNDLANIPATLTFDVNLKELLDNEGIDFMQTFFRLITVYKVKSNVSKTAMKDIIKEGLFDVSKIAHIEQNQSITIK